MHAFLKEFNIENKKNITGFDNKAKSAIIKYSWPGNIRELRNCIESAVVMCNGEIITPDDLPESVRNNSTENAIIIPMGTTVEDAENIIIRENLAFNNGNKSKTAEILGIGRKTLQRKLVEMGIEKEEDE
jgi:DNA-binding NtrC family response regulator